MPGGQMKRILSIKCFLLVVGMALSITGCVRSTSYVDPSYGKVGYENLTRRVTPYQWQITAEFQRNGTHFAKVDESLLGKVELVVRASGMATPSTDASAPKLKVIVNNIADLGEARAKGFGTGLTFGLAGSLVTDFYEMEVALTDGDKVIRKTGYRHALYSTIGNASGPPGLTPTTPAEGFSKIVEQLMLNALKDIEKESGSSGQTSEVVPSNWWEWRHLGRHFS